jgi:uncharacterized membrane protein YdfJ with MMPL/SSD domain
LLLVAGALVAAFLLGSPALSELRVSGSDTLDSTSQSAKAFALLASAERHELKGAPPLAVLVRLHAPSSAPASERRLQKVQSIVAASPGVRSFSSTSSRDKAWAIVVVAPRSDQSSASRLQTATVLRDRLDRLDGVLVGGRDAAISELGAQAREDVRSGELIAFPFLLLVLVWVFRSFLLALLPLLGGAISFFGALVVVRLLHSAGLQFPLLAVVPLLGLSLGLSVDYALLLIGRYREEYVRHKCAATALRAARRSVSPTIATSAVAIALALAPLALIPIPFFEAIGIATGICALLAGGSALLVTPLLLSLYGERISSSGALNRLFAPRLRRSGRFWRVVPGFGIRRPKLTIVLVTGVLLVLAAPLGAMKIGGINSTQLSEGSESGRVYQVLQERFDPELSRERYELFLEEPGDREGIDRVISAVREMEGVREVGPALRMVGTWNVEVLGDGAVGSPASQATAERLRSISSRLYVASVSGVIVDRDRAVERMAPLVMSLAGVALLLLAFGLLGSLLVPLKLVLLTLLTIASTLGVMVAAFQWPGGGTAFDVSQIVLLVALILPLIMDYGLFVASRIAEAHRQGEENVTAIADGLASTGPVVSAAGAVFCVAVGAFAFSEITLVQQVSVGLVVAVFIDTTLVRALLVPATMTALGRWNWWAPSRASALRGRVADRLSALLR